MARRNNLPLFILVLLAVGLSACAASVDQTITFLDGERWQTSVDLAFPAEVTSFIGGTIDGELTTLQEQIEAGGGSMSWARESDDSGRLVYRIEAEGTGYDVLDDVAFGDMSVEAQEQDGERQLTFRALPMPDAATQSLTLSGGEILTSNGTVSGGDTVSWVNPTQPMEAVLTERGGAAAIGLLPVALVGAGVLLLALLGLLFLRGRRPAPTDAAPPSPAPQAGLPAASPADNAPPAPGLAAIAPQAARYCVSCGGALRPAARFCAACGQPQPD